MQVINFFGSPGVGKSITAAAVYAELAKNRLNVELCTEYAKTLVYEDRTDILKNDQLYILAKQNRKLYTLSKQDLDYVVLDSPLPIQMIYNNPENLDQELFEKLVLTLFNKFDNINFYLERGSGYRYQSVGRVHSLEESQLINQKIKEKLDIYKIPYTVLESSNHVVDDIVSLIFRKRLTN